MTEKEILDLAKKFLKTEAGKKLAKIGLDGNDLEKAKDDVKEGKAKEELENRLKPYIPVLEEFIVIGRLYDDISNEPIKNAKVTPVLALGRGVRTNEKGEYSIKLKIPILPFNQRALVQPQLVHTKDGFIPATQEVLDRNRIVKQNLKTRGLINIDKAAELASSEARKEVQLQLDRAAQIALSIPEKIIVVRRNQVNKLNNAVLFKLLPLAIGLLLIFGITKISDLKNAICPSPEQLKQAVNRRNKIVRQLNQIFKLVAVNTALAALFLFIAGQLKTVKRAISNLSFPTAVPPGVGVPYSLISRLQDVKDLLDGFVEENKKMNKQLLVSLIFLVAAFLILLLILRAVDDLIFRCSQDQEIELEEINSDLRKLEKQAGESEATSAPNEINGFILEVIEIDKNSVNGFKRKQAVGKNGQGTILVRGEPSFSAGETILINELAFYIRSNDLKAY